MIIGTGIDIVEVPRIREAHEKWGDRFTRRILTDAEIEGAGKGMGLYSYIASRFAAKEAFLKALGTGLSGGIRWIDMEVRREKGRRPFFHVTGKASGEIKRLGVKRIHLSLAHEREYAVAQVVLEG